MLCRWCRSALEARARAPTAAHLPRRLAPPSLLRRQGASYLQATTVTVNGRYTAAQSFHSGPVRWAKSAVASRKRDARDADKDEKEDDNDEDADLDETARGSEEAVDAYSATGEAEEIWNALLTEDSSPTEEEVYQHVDSLRPAYDIILPRSEFQRLASTLVSSFTAVQLQAYLRKNAASTASPATVYAWEDRRRPWVPEAGADDDVVPAPAPAPRRGKADSAQQLQHLLLRGYVTRATTSKERLALQVLRGCWGLSMREMMDVPGHVDVVVQPLALALLVAGAQTWLPAISEAFSSVIKTTAAMTSRSRNRSHSRSETRQQRHIALLPQARTLRVFAPQATADAILAEIDAKLRKARTQRYPLSAFHLATGAGNVSADEPGAGGGGKEAGEDEDHSWIEQAHEAAAAEAAEAEAKAVEAENAEEEPEEEEEEGEEEEEEEEDVAAKTKKPTAARAKKASAVVTDFREVLKTNTDLLRSLGALTRSWVRVEDDNSISVSWVDVDEAQAATNGETENVGDTVFRLLLRAAHEWRATSMRSGPVSLRLDHQMSARQRARARATGRFLVETDAAARATLPWYHRAGRWARWIEPMPSAPLRAQQTFGVRAPAANALPLDFVIRDLAESDRSQQQQQQPRPWFRKSLVSTVATFGRVVHAQPAAEEADAAQAVVLYEGETGTTGTTTATTATTAIANRLLIPVEPPLLGLHFGQGVVPTMAPGRPFDDDEADNNGLNNAPPAAAPVTTATTIRLSLLPRPATGLAHYAPAIEVLLDVPEAEGESGGGPPVFSELRVIQSTSICDTLFPTQPVDARTTQTRYAALTADDLAAGPVTGTEKNTDVSAVLQFVETLQPHLQAVLKDDDDDNNNSPFSETPTTPKAKTVKLPPSIGLDIPADVGAVTLPQYVLHVKRRPIMGYRPVELHYVLAGIEVRHRVATAYAGWTLALTSVDGGADGGQRTELTLEAVPAEGGVEAGAGGKAVAAAADPMDKHGFRAAVGAVATGQDLYWTMPYRMVA